MKAAVCFTILVIACVIDGSLGTSIAIKDSNMDRYMQTSLITVATATYNKASDAQDFTKRLVQTFSYSYPLYYWNALYNTLAYSTSQLVYAELKINGKDVVYVHGLKKVC